MLLTLKCFGICSADCNCNECKKDLICDQCDYISIWHNMNNPVNCLEGGVKNCPFIVKDEELQTMALEQARESAEALVFVNMNRSDIENACLKYNIKISMDRSTMEKALIKKFTKKGCYKGA